MSRPRHFEGGRARRLCYSISLDSHPFASYISSSFCFFLWSIILSFFPIQHINLWRRSSRRVVSSTLRRRRASSSAIVTFSASRSFLLFLHSSPFLIALLITFSPTSLSELISFLSPSDCHRSIIIYILFRLTVVFHAKVKSPMYVQVALLTATDKDGLNARRLLEVVQLNEGSEFLSYFPQWVALYTLV